MSAIRIEAKKAVHSGGTKFYHVLRVINTVGNKSFALRHYGKVEMFTGIAKLALGTIEEETGVVSGDLAGATKWREKEKKGYVNEVEEQSWDFDTVDAAHKFLDSRLNDKALSLVKVHLRGTDFQSGLVAGASPGSSTASTFTREPDEPSHLKHAEWGSW